VWTLVPWNTSLTSPPRRSSSFRAVSISETARYKPWAEPGAAVVTFLPKITDHPEPGGVNWTPRQSSPAVKSASTLHPSLT
jgi:hypothetical protein